MNRVHAAVKAIIERGNKFLIIKKVFGNDVVWDFPGGKVKYSESPYETLQREIKEEVNLDVDIVKSLGAWCFFRRHSDNDQVVCLAFLCRTKNKNVDIYKNPADEDIKEFKWVTKEEFLSDKHPVDNESVKKLVAENL